MDKKGCKFCGQTLTSYPPPQTITLSRQDWDVVLNQRNADYLRHILHDFQQPRWLCRGCLQLSKQDAYSPVPCPGPLQKNFIHLTKEDVEKTLADLNR